MHVSMCMHIYRMFHKRYATLREVIREVMPSEGIIITLVLFPTAKNLRMFLMHAGENKPDYSSD
jgi:hypothetical protein